MEIRPSARLTHYKTGIFAALDEEKDKILAQGGKIYNLSIGTPDFVPPQHVIDALKAAADDPNNWKYALKDSDALLDAVADYYNRRFHTVITRDMIVSVHGTQEGMGHLGLALLNPGDAVLLPDPSYPIFEVGAYFGEAEICYYPLVKENNFLPRLDQIDEAILRRVKYIVLSYPSNPVGAAADKDTYREIMDYARKYGFMILNDNAYSDIIFDGREGFSFLSMDGAAEIGAEFFSLSKSFNVTGARISFLIGNKKIIDAVKLLRSQYDFGMFLPVQAAAVAALNGSRDSVTAQCAEYQRRRDAFCGGLRKHGWNIPDSHGTMFVWAPLPEGYTDSDAFCHMLLNKTGVLCTPGFAFGPHGEGYVRFALVKPAEELAQIAELIGKTL
ncbi:MAG: aminotransferase class I/II-fold pyridoxal phosphate-dependent enzyme [Clostridia bacterium]|nr:aminotransferase class I/II-fold pyridoxal phosphate-dependent enzyme [Clostridia bacterium]